MEQKKKMVTVTVTEENEEPRSLTDNNVFLISNEKGFLTVDCNSRELFEFAIKIQAYFFKVIMPRLMVGTKPYVTEDILFNHIVEVAKETANDSFVEVTE